MTPIIEEKHLLEGQEICQRLVQSMAQLDPRSCMVGLAMACVFAADSTDTPLESVFQMMRDFRKAFQVAQKQIDESKLVVVP